MHAKPPSSGSDKETHGTAGSEFGRAESRRLGDKKRLRTFDVHESNGPTRPLVHPRNTGCWGIVTLAKNRRFLRGSAVHIGFPNPLIFPRPIFGGGVKRKSRERDNPCKQFRNSRMEPRFWMARHYDARSFAQRFS